MMGNLSDYIQLIIVVIAFGTYVVILERRLTRIETALEYIQRQIQDLAERLRDA